MATIDDIRHLPTSTLLRPSEIAGVFSVNVKTISRWTKEGRLVGTRTPGGHVRITAGEVLRALHAANPW